jgi:hypothetical protein
MSTGALRLPTRWHEPGTGVLMRLPTRLMAALGAQLRDDDPRGAALAQALLLGDPLADAVADWMKTAPAENGRALFERALEHGIDAAPQAPSVLVALFKQLEAVPSWLDRDALGLAEQTMLRVGRAGLYALGGAALMSGYLSSGAVKPLALTGALIQMAPRRLAETTRFVWALSTSNRMGRFSEGWKTTVRVRLLHAIVRRGLAASPRWNAEAWGRPVNQRDMVGTHLEFSVAYIAGLTTLGILVNRREREALMHLWRYVGHLLGIIDDLLPKTFREGLEVAWLFNQTEAGPDDDSRALAAALLAVRYSPHRWGRRLEEIEARFLGGYSRLLLGKKAADALQLPNNLWQLSPLFIAPLGLGLELLRLLMPGGTALAVRIGRAMTEHNLKRQLKGKLPTYEPHHIAGSALGS